MANTAAGRQLTEQHRRRQLALRAQVLRDLTEVWPGFDVDDLDGSWRQIQPFLVALVERGYEDSARLAANYWRGFELLEASDGPSVEPPEPAKPDRTLTVATLNLVGVIGAKKNISAGRQDVAARTFTRLAGSMGRQILEGGRRTLVEAAKADPRARGFRRVTDASPCDFCAGIRDEGVIAATDAAGFPAHDHCGCTAEPAF